MNTVTICTPMRDSAALLEDYASRVYSLDFPKDALRIVIAEGDSTDGTKEKLANWQREDNRLTVVHVDTGLPRYGSVVNDERFAILSQVFNAALECVDTAWSTHVLFLPDDITYQPDLLNRLLAHNVDAVAPLVWGDWGDNPYFYDTWAFSRNGQCFTNFNRTWARQHLGERLLEMETIGGTMLFRSVLLQAGCWYTPQEVDRGFCKMASAYGFKLWCDPSTNVGHGA